MDDGVATVALYAIKLLRFSVLWIALFVVEKVYQNSYVTLTLIRDQPPPDLRPMVVYALAVDLVFSVFVLVVLGLLRSQNREPTYALDSDLARLFVVDYLASVAVVLFVGRGLAAVVQDKHLLRYRDDGLRSTRALGTLILWAAMIALAVPYYKLLM